MVRRCLFPSQRPPKHLISKVNRPSAPSACLLMLRKLPYREKPTASPSSDPSTIAIYCQLFHSITCSLLLPCCVFSSQHLLSCNITSSNSILLKWPTSAAPNSCITFLHYLAYSFHIHDAWLLSLLHHDFITLCPPCALKYAVIYAVMTRLYRMQAIMLLAFF